MFLEEGDNLINSLSSEALWKHKSKKFYKSTLLVFNAMDLPRHFLDHTIRCYIILSINGGAEILDIKPTLSNILKSVVLSFLLIRIFEHYIRRPVLEALTIMDWVIGTSVYCCSLKRGFPNDKTAKFLYQGRKPIKLMMLYLDSESFSRRLTEDLHEQEDAIILAIIRKYFVWYSVFFHFLISISTHE